MKIGNVIYDSELVNHKKVDYINYIEEPRVYKELDPSLPTLYVGWSFMKSCNPEDDIIQNADILKKKIITNELYYEFSFLESKASHVKGVDKFVGLVPQFYFSPKYRYTNLDPVFFQLKDYQDLMDIFPKDLTKAYNYKNEMLYVLNDNNIWGLNLKMYEFFKFNVNDIINHVETKAYSYKSDLDGEIYKKHYKNFPNFEQLKRYLVTL